MKRLFVVGALVASLVICSAGGCSRAERSEKRSRGLRSEEADRFMIRYVRIRPDNSVYLALSRETASAHGVADADYERALDAIDATNDFLRALYVKEPNMHVNFGFPVPPQLPRIPDYSK